MFCGCVTRIVGLNHCKCLPNFLGEGLGFKEAQNRDSSTGCKMLAVINQHTFSRDPSIQIPKGPSTK